MDEAVLDYKEKYQSACIEIINLRHELDQLRRLVFGSRHERFIANTPPEQLALDLTAETVQAAPVPVQAIEYTRQRRKEKTEKVQTGRMRLPADLPREQVILEPEGDVSGLKKIGEEITEELERIPGRLFVRQYVRPKYAKAGGEGVLIADLPVRPIDKGIPGPGLLAQIIIDKYTDHLPVHRQIQRFGREGIKLSSSTLTDWIGGTCTLLEPLYDTLKANVLSSHYLQADETPIKVLDKDKKGTTHRGYHWVYHAPVERLVLFDYREGRGREGPQEILKDFTGHLQTDGYAVYQDFDKKSTIKPFNCMAHARRKFDEAKDNDLVRASYALTEIQKVYAIERQAKNETLSTKQRQALRQEQSLPILQALKDWMLENYKMVLPKSAIGQALHYSLERFDKLMLYTTDGKLEVDNNLIENAIRPVAIGRKNYLFAGSHNGARRAAMLYSFIGTCKINDVNPFEWLKNTLETIPQHPVNKLYELIPRKV
ncbi:MAG: IS66 family transposase [Cytophagales bacterium]|uniref:IS66 family transposase n=1 Tax=unclassified Microcystis TaxID=2643300 RepID=UPI00257FF689|nr:MULTISPECIES: IS66 family transposase [unclassified Microcystis]MCA2702939.1 IS66 family transposase [Microcystis sp. M179S2]MCA2724429.1 IS66 family transposase [Microcystis sp. M166S2]MCA6431714.1 IS66 family transposase [Cytophagales bacterium]